MFCPNCGINLDDGTVFCGNCGFNVAESEGAGETALLTEPPVNFVRNQPVVGVNANQPVNQVSGQKNVTPSQKTAEKPKSKKEKKPKEKKKKKTGLIVTLVLVFLALCAIILALIGLVVGSFFVTPDAQAEKFASYLEDGDTKGLYDMMFDENSIITYEQFADAYLNSEDFGLDKYEGKTGHQVVLATEGELISNYYARFIGGGALYFDVEKVEDGFWYFDEYRIVTEDCPDYEVYVPEGARLFVDDVEILSEPEKDVVTGLDKYNLAPLLTGEYDLRVEYGDKIYEKRICVFTDLYYNTLILDPEEIEYGSTIQEASAYTTADAEAFFNKMMNEYTYNSYRVVYYGTPESLTTYGIESIIINDYRLRTGNEYNSALETVTDKATNGVLISDVMTEDEYNSLAANSDGYMVYKLAEVQNRINQLWGTGAVSVSSLMNDDDIITSKGFLLRDGEDAQRGKFDYYGKVKSSKLDENANRVVIEAYILKCDTESKKIYDEGTGLQIATAQITRGEGVDFDAIVEELKINTKKMSPIKFSFQLSDYGITLLGATENAISEDVINAQNAVLQYYPQSFYMKVKADGGLNMRYEPTGKSEILKLIPNNSAVEVRGYSENVDDWVYVYFGGYEGWVSYSHLFPTEYTSQPSGKIYWYKVKADGGLNMRKADNQKAKLVKLIPDKSVVKLICYNQDATWAYVTYNDLYAGWVNTNYIEYGYSTES